MACRDFRTIAHEAEARRKALAGKPDATLDQRLAALQERARVRLNLGHKNILADALGAEDDERYVPHRWR